MMLILGLVRLSKGQERLGGLVHRRNRDPHGSSPTKELEKIFPPVGAIPCGCNSNGTVQSSIILRTFIFHDYNYYFLFIYFSVKKDENRITMKPICLLTYFLQTQLLYNWGRSARPSLRNGLPFSLIQACQNCQELSTFQKAKQSKVRMSILT